MRQRTPRIGLWARRFGRKALAILTAGGLLASLAMPAQAAYDWTDVDNILTASTGNPNNYANEFAWGALVINHKGNLKVHEAPFGTWSGQTPAQLDNFPGGAVNVASVSKTVSMLLAYSIMNNAPSAGVALSDHITESIPNATTINTAPNFYQDMTLEHLMSMTSAIRSYLEINSCVGHSWYGFTWCADNLIGKTPATHYVNGVLTTLKPGDMFTYSAADWQILGLGLMNAVNTGYGTSKSFDQVYQDYFLGSGYCDLPGVTIGPNNNPSPAGGIDVSSMTDAAKLAEILRTGVCNGHTIMTAAQHNDAKVNRIPCYVENGYAFDSACRQTLPSGCTSITGGGVNPYVDTCIHYNIDISPAPTSFKLTSSSTAVNLARITGYGIGQWISPDTRYPDLRLGIGANGAVVFYDDSRQLSGFLLVQESNSLVAIDYLFRLMSYLYPAIAAQADANP